MAKVKGRLENDTLVLTIAGRLDSVNIDSVQAQIAEYAASVPVKNMTFDMDQANETFAELGMDDYIDGFKEWYEGATGGSCEKK